MEDEIKTEKARYMVQKISADDIIHKVYLKMQTRFDDLFFRVQRLEILVHSIKHTLKNTDIDQAEYQLDGIIDVYNEDKKLMSDNIK